MIASFNRTFLLVALMSTALAAYTSYVSDYHESTGTLYNFLPNAQGRRDYADFPSHPEAQEALAGLMQRTDPMRTDEDTSRELMTLLRTSEERSRYLLQTALHPDKIGSMSNDEKQALLVYKTVYDTVRRRFDDNRGYAGLLHNAGGKEPVNRMIAFVKVTAKTLSRAKMHLDI